MRKKNCKHLWALLNQVPNFTSGVRERDGEMLMIKGKTIYFCQKCLKKKYEQD